jgi:hypothetical protein
MDNIALRVQIGGQFSNACVHRLGCSLLVNRSIQMGLGRIFSAKTLFWTLRTEKITRWPDLSELRFTTSINKKGSLDPSSA